MATTITQFAQVALTATLTSTIYTTPVSSSTILKEIIIANTDSATRQVTLRIGGSGVANTILPAIKVNANTITVISLSTVIPANTVISGGADVAGVVGVTLSGVIST